MMRIHAVVVIACALGLSGCGSDEQVPNQSAEGAVAAETAAPAEVEVVVVRTPESVTRSKPGDWGTYNRELSATRYSPLTQINRDNVTSLKQVWSQSAGSQATPLVIDGIMYVSAAKGAVAYDGATGTAVWNFELPEGARASQRGVSYWSGDGTLAARIFFTSGPRIVALDAATGTLAAGFGENGSIDTVVPYNSPPTIYKNLVIIGANTLEIPVGIPGNTRAYDARTGAKVWEFNTVPQPGEVGHETWLDEGWKGRSGVNVWSFSMTVDEDRGLLYMPVAGAAANYWGGDRPGANLFANSIVAVDAETGAYRWHFQTSHHDIWDSDQPSTPALLDIEKDSKTIPALAIVGKTSYMFILNRETGEPVFGVEERPVPAGDVPGEWYSPTQPFPVKPPPLSRVSFSPEDMVTAEDTTPEHAAACQALWDRSGGFRNEGPFTPFSFHEEGAPPKSTVQFPGGTGGVNWGGVAADPINGYVFANAHDTSLAGWVEVKKAGSGSSYGRGTEASTQPYDRASVDGPGPYAGFNARVTDAEGKTVGFWPCQKPPWAELVAVDATTGEIAWRSVLGLQEGLPPDKQLVGGSGSSGPMVTAGGLVFIGATDDKRFRAFDAKTGEQVWEVQLEQGAHANPMSYLGRDGRQYVAVVARDAVKVFGLP